MQKQPLITNVKHAKINTLQNQTFVNAQKHTEQQYEFQVDLPDLAQESVKQLTANNIKTCKKHQGQFNGNYNGAIQQNNLLNDSCQRQINDEDIDFEQIQKRLQKFVNFINFHDISSQDIWNGSRQLSLNQFCTKVHQNVGYYLTNNQLGALMRILSVKDLVRPNDFIKIGCWMNTDNKRTGSITLSYSNSNSRLSQTNLNLNLHTKSKTNKDLNNQMKPIIKAYQCKQNILKVNNKKQDSEIELSLLKNSNTTSNMKKSTAKMLSLARSKQKIQSLENDIRANVLQKKWNFVVMVGQMNQWLEKQSKKSVQLGLSNVQPKQSQDLPIRYKIYNHPQDGTFQISQQDNIKNVQQFIPEIVFIKKYESLKKKTKAQTNNKSNLKGTVLMVLEDNDKLTKNTLANRLDQRDQELNYVLIQIMRMKSIFSHQYKILKQNSINT